MSRKTDDKRIEADVKAWVKAMLKPYVDSGEAYVNMPVPFGFGRSQLDFTICWRGWFVTIETKRPKGNNATGRQVETMLAIERARGIVLFVFDREGVEAAERILNRLPSLVRPWPSMMEQMGLAVPKVEVEPYTMPKPEELS